MTRALEPPTGNECWVFERTHTEEVVRLALDGGEVAIITQTSPASSDENEDAAAVVASTSRSSLLAVADGFGGGPAGERASRLAIDEIAARADHEALGGEVHE